MRKTHLNYLKRAVGLALATADRTTLLRQLEAVKCASGPVYRLMRDIVCDSRFYGVVENTPFWKDYAVTAVGLLIDSIEGRMAFNGAGNISENTGRHGMKESPGEDSGKLKGYGSEEERVTIEKEDFLNAWLSDHIIPLTDDELERRRRKLKEVAVGGNLMFENPAEGNAAHMGPEFTYGLGIHDKTNDEEEPQPDLPDEARSLLAGADDVLAGLPGEWERRENEYLRLMDRSLLELARRIGRSGGVAEEVKGRFTPAAKSDIAGIMNGDDLNRMLPAETALLASAETEKLFYSRFASRRLQIFSSASRSARPEVREKGPVYICIDTSGSMTGEPEMMAKNLALSITMIAQREKRPVFVVNYSHTLSFFVVTDLRAQRKKFLTFLSRSYSGGNDETKLFRFLFRSLPESPGFKRYARILEGADLLIVSDFQWGRIEPETRVLLDLARTRGMNTYSLGIGLSPRETYTESVVTADEGGGYRNGHMFFNDSDFRYVYNGRRLHELP